MSIEMIEPKNSTRAPDQGGVGGGGGNAVEHMIARHVQGVEFICANTDARRSRSRRTAPSSWRQRPGRGQQARQGPRGRRGRSRRHPPAIAARTCCSSPPAWAAAPAPAPVIAHRQGMGILTVGVVTKPFEWEGGRRMPTPSRPGRAGSQRRLADRGAQRKLLEVLGDDITQDEAFAHANDVLKNAVGGIAEIINEYGHERRLRRRAHRDGRARQGHDGHGHRQRPDRARIAAEQAVACPLLEGIDLSGAKGVLVLITAAKGSLKLSNRGGHEHHRAYASPDAHVIYGAAYDDALGDELRVTVVATGLSRPGTPPPADRVVQGGLRTGTDNVPFTMAPTA
jgi:cell division protein FtsZ